MKNLTKNLFLVAIIIILTSAGATVFAYQAPTANAGPDLYVNSSQTIVLQGSGYDANGSSLTYYWNCSGGTLSNYNIAQPTFIAPNNNNQTYNCSLTVTNSYSLSASDNMTVFANSGSTNTEVGIANLTVTKKVINLSSGNLNWQTSVNANPGDILSFAITLQATGGQDTHNVFVTDFIPSNFIYRGNLLVNSSQNYGGNPASGISIGTISPGSIVVVSYQAQVASATNFVYGTTTLSNNATVTSTELGTQTASASVLVNNPVVQGATTIPTGITNNPISSFFLPVMLIILMSYLYFSGNIYRFSDWLGEKI